MDHDHGSHTDTTTSGSHGDHGNGGHGDHDMGGGGHGGGHGMAMYFTVSEHATILFKGWMTMTWAGER